MSLYKSEFKIEIIRSGYDELSTDVEDRTINYSCDNSGQVVQTVSR